MEIDDDMYVVLSSPVECTEKVWPCTGNVGCNRGCVLSVRFCQRNRPISKRYATYICYYSPFSVLITDSSPNVVEASGLYGYEIVFGYPLLPMVLEHIKGDVTINQLSESEFVNDIGVVRPFKETGRYPWLEKEVVWTDREQEVL